MKKKLTGQMIYEYRISIKKFENFFAPDWAQASQLVQDEFNDMATALNEILGLCCSCGERPDTGLIEISAGHYCKACLTMAPLQEEGERAEEHEAEEIRSEMRLQGK